MEDVVMSSLLYVALNFLLCAAMLNDGIQGLWNHYVWS